MQIIYGAQAESSASQLECQFLKSERSPSELAGLSIVSHYFKYYFQF